MDPKQLAGEQAAAYVENNMVIGLGTGSTACWAIKKIGERIANEGLQLTCTATSIQSEKLAEQFHIPLTDIAEVNSIDITIDGADEIDRQLDMIKGGGGALLREKIIANITKHYIIVADESKYVAQLGAFGIPVEVVPFGWQRTAEHLEKLGAKPALRKKEQETFITDNGNYILDCDFGLINDAASLETSIHNIPGVVVCGLFISRAHKLILGKKDGSTEEITIKR